MKLHLPLLLLSALLATAPAKAEYPLSDFIYFLPSGNPAHNVAYIHNGTKVQNVDVLAVLNPFFFISGLPFNTQDAAFEFPKTLKDYSLRITSTAIFTNRQLATPDDYINIWCTLNATQGSILLKNVKLKDTELITKTDGTANDFWGLPQVALNNAIFVDGATTVHSNYFTVQWWETGSHTFYLNEAAGSFIDGEATGNIEIQSNSGVEVRNVAITNGSLKILDSATATPNDWVVKLRNIQADNGITVQATPGRGLIEVNSLIESKDGIDYSFAAREVLFSAFSRGNVDIHASERVTLSGFAQAHDLAVRPYDGHRPDIEIKDSLSVTDTITLTGKNIVGNNAKSVISASLYVIDATGEVNFQGVFNGDKMDLTAGEDVTMKSFQGRILDITSNKSITLDSVGTMMNPVSETTITAGKDIRVLSLNSKVATLTSKASEGSVALESFQGEMLNIDSKGTVTLNAVGSLEKSASMTTITADKAIRADFVNSIDAKLTCFSGYSSSLNLESFLGTTLTVISNGAISIGNIGSLEKTVVSATITGSSAAPVTVESFHGGENGTLQIDSHGIVTIGRQKEQGSADIPAYEGNVTVNYLGEGTGAENWDVDMLGVMRGSLTVNAVNGKVNAGHIVGSGDITAKQINIASFSGSNLDIKANYSVTVGGNIDATGSLAIGELNGQRANVLFQTYETIAAKEISILGNDIKSGSEDLVISAERYQIDAQGTISISGNVNVVGDAEMPSTIKAATGVVIGGTADLANTTITAPQLSIGKELILKDGSIIYGNVISERGADITVENSRITGAVRGTEDNAVTVTLTDSIIGGAEKFSTLTAQGASGITSDLVLGSGATLAFILTEHNIKTPVLTIGGELKAENPEAASFIINLAGDNLPVLQKYALIITAKDQAPDFWKSASVGVEGLTSDTETLFWEDGILYFSLGGPDLKVATWTGDKSFAWDKETSNWKQDDKTYMYADGVAVVFNDDGKAGEVELNGALAPKSVLVENSVGHDYTFTDDGYTGDGKITGKTVLVKQGAGKLTINTANDFDGGTTIRGGTLLIGNNTALGTGKVTLVDATLDLGNYTLANAVSVTGEDAKLGNGRLNGTLSVEDGRKLTLLGGTTIAKNITLGNGAALDLGKNKIDGVISMEGDAILGNGELGADLAVKDGRKLTLSNELTGKITISLGSGARLDLGDSTLSTQKVDLKGDAFIGNGTLQADVTMVAANTLTLSGNLKGDGIITLAQNSTLDLSSHALSNAVVAKGDAFIGSGILDGDLSVEKENMLTLSGNLKGTGTIDLADQVVLNLNSNGTTNAITIAKTATIRSGWLNGNRLTVLEGGKLTLGDHNVATLGNLSLSLKDNASVNLGGNTLGGTVSLEGNAFIGNGTLNADVAVNAEKTLTLCDGNLGGEGIITLADEARLNLSGYTLSKAVVLAGDATIGNGTINKDVTVGDGFTLTLSDDLSGAGAIILKSQSYLDTDSGAINPNILGNAVKVAGEATIHGTFEGKISVDAGQSLMFEKGTAARSGIELGQGSELDLGENSIYSPITLVGDAAIGNGTVNADVAVGAGHKLTLTSDLAGTGAIVLNEGSSLTTAPFATTYILDNAVKVAGNATIYGNVRGKISVDSGKRLVLESGTTIGGNIDLGDWSALDLGGAQINTAVTLAGNAMLGNGTLNTDITVGKNKTLTLLNDLNGSGTINLSEDATLDLGSFSLASPVKLEGSASIGNGTLNSDVDVLGDCTLTLCGYLRGNGTITLSYDSTLDLDGHTLSNKVVLRSNAYINTGILNGDLSVGEEGKLTLKGSFVLGTGTVSLADKATLDLNEKIFALAVAVSGNATISNGSLSGNTLTVENNSKLTLGDHNVATLGNLSLSLKDNASVNLGGNTLGGTVSLEGNASIGNGTLNADVAVNAEKTLTLCDGDLGGEGIISLAHLAKLDLGTHTLSKAVALAGSATIGNGALDADLTVGDGFTLTLSDNLEGKGTIILKEKSHLNTDSGGTNPNILYNAVEVAGDATIHGTFYGHISVDEGKKLVFQSDTIAAGGIDLAQGSELDLGSNNISTTITLVGDASLGNGTVKSDVAVGAGHKLTLTSDLTGSGAIVLNEGASLETDSGDTYPNILENAVKVAGNATIHGTVYGKISVGEGKKLEFKNGTTAAGGIDLAQGSELDLGGNQTITAINLAGDATIGNGVINDAANPLAVAVEKTLNLRGSVEGTRAISLNTDSTLRLTDGTSVANKITGGLSATIVQTDHGTGTITGDLSEFIGNVKVESAGTLNIMNSGSMDGVDVSLARNTILGVYKGAKAEEASEGTLTISADRKLTAAFHAQLNANLVMASGSVLDVAATGGESGGLHMGSTLTLDPGNVLLSEADMDAVSGLRCMQAYDLFSGVDALYLDNGTNFLVELGLSDPWVKASEVFANDLFKRAEREYYLFYSGANQGGGVAGYEGTVYLLRVPEPTTGTLSLLALAALAARRRRK